MTVSPEQRKKNHIDVVSNARSHTLHERAFGATDSDNKSLNAERPERRHPSPRETTVLASISMRRFLAFLVLVSTGVVGPTQRTGTTLSNLSTISPLSSATVPITTLAPPATAPVTSELPTGSTPPSSSLPTSTRTWTLAFGGDTLFTRPLAVLGSRSPFDRVDPAFRRADLTIVNLETALTTRGTQQTKTYTFRSPPGFAHLLQQAGVDVVSLANNHVLDYGTIGLADTLAALDAAGVARTGAGLDAAEALSPVSIELGNGTETLRVAVLAASQIIPNAGWVARPASPGIASAGKHVIDTNTERVVVAVKKAARDHQVVIVVMHWGIEGDPCPSPIQRRLSRVLVDAGADIVLGAHPHILQPIEQTGTSIVAYSLGNFIWDPRSGATGDSGVLTVDFQGEIARTVNFIPHRLDANGWAATIPATGKAASVRARTTRVCR